jgi:hypothetical protein
VFSKRDIRKGDILVEKYISSCDIDGREDEEIITIFLVLGRHMESAPLVDGYEKTLYYKTLLMYVNDRDWKTFSGYDVNSIYYLSEHEMTSIHEWERLFESDLSWNDSYPRI